MIWRDEVLGLETRGDGLVVALAITRGAPGRAVDIAGRLDANRLRARLSAWGRAPARTYVCGANRFVEAMTQALVGSGVAASSIRAERYGGSG